MAEPRHFLDLDQFDTATLRAMLDAGLAMKQARAGQPRGALDEKAPLDGAFLFPQFLFPFLSSIVIFDKSIGNKYKSLQSSKERSQESCRFL